VVFGQHVLPQPHTLPYSTSAASPSHNVAYSLDGWLFFFPKHVCIVSSCMSPAFPTLSFVSRVVIIFLPQGGVSFPLTCSRSALGDLSVSLTNHLRSFFSLEKAMLPHLRPELRFLRDGGYFPILTVPPQDVFQINPFFSTCNHQGPFPLSRKRGFHSPLYPRRCPPPL